MVATKDGTKLRDIVSGPSLTVRFIGTARFHVREGRDFRGWVIPLGTAEDDECPQSP